MKINITKNNHLNPSSIFKYGILISVLLILFLSQISCGNDSKNNRTFKNNPGAGKTTENNVTKLDPKTNNYYGYVNQSRKISNGEDYGIEVLAIRRTANNYMLDFRFKITDVEKAKYIMQRKIKAQLTIEKDKSTLVVPVSYKLGALRQSGKNLKVNKNYFMFFANPGGRVKKDDLVTVEIAGFKAEHIIVN